LTEIDTSKDRVLIVEDDPETDEVEEDDLDESAQEYTEPEILEENEEKLGSPVYVGDFDEENFE